MQNDDKPQILELIKYNQDQDFAGFRNGERTFVGPFPNFGEAHKFMGRINFINHYDVILIHVVMSQQEYENDGKMR